MHDQLIKDLRANPFTILDKLSIKEIIAIIKEANNAYHRDGKPLFTDDTYELIKSYLAKLVPDHPILNIDVGALPKKGKVKLPIWMGSLDKIKEDPQVLQKWKTDHKNEYVVSDKLDGISCLVYVENGTTIMYTRGDGNFGQNIGHLLKYVNGIPNNLREGIMVRGELILSKTAWSSINGERNNPRNTVAGIANSKKPDKNIASKIDFVAYDLIQPVKKPFQGLESLKELGFYTVFNKVFSEEELDTEKLSGLLLKRRKQSPYEIDGLVVTHNKVYERPEQENPTYSFAFKSVITNEKAEVLVKEVVWNISKNGLLKPVVVFDTVYISGVHVHRATAHNAQFIAKNIIGPGSRITIIRSGDVIPYILAVHTPSSSGEPSYPNTIDYPWKWNETKVDLILENPLLAKEYQIRQLENYSNVLAIKGLGPKIIKQLYDRGIDSVKKLVNVTKSELYKATLSSKLTMKIYHQMQAIYDKGSCVEFMVASNIFGAGMGKRKLQMITEMFPSILENDPPSLTTLLETKGVGERFARQLIEHLPEFHDFIQEVGLPCRSTKVDFEPTPEGYMSLYGKVIVFTGFRSKEMEEFIAKRGGKVGSSVNSSTSMLVAKNVEDTNIKIETAKELAIPIISSKVFVEEVGFQEGPKPFVDQEELDKEFEKMRQELEDEGLFEEEAEDDDDEDEVGLNKSAECVRHALNWANMKRTHIFGKSTFEKESVQGDMHKASPKLFALLKNIRELDESDMHTHGKHFKHMIFSDVTKRGFGAKILASGLEADGYRHAYDKEFKLSSKDLKKNKGRNFAVLASTQIYTKPINVDFKQKLLATFNARPNNIYGDEIRFIVLDTGYKEGIDLFDVKYVHLYEPTLTYADQMQAIGRATRFCGQKGLHFEPNKGWTLHIYKYEHVLPPALAEIYSGQNSFELIMKEINRNQNWLKLTQDMERVCQDAAVDKDYTKNIHITGGNNNYKWPKMKTENMCETTNKTANKLVDFSPSQEFVRNYFQPASAVKGMLLWHSLGSGKTCTAISTASLSWEAEGYTILWVTRGTLRSDVYKNIFDMSCMERLRDLIKSGIDIPEGMAKRKRLLSKSWLPPISFKQFTNMLSKQNRLYDFMLKRNGFTDPFKKTLIIIDEAHLMMSPTMKEKEKPDVDLLKKWIRQSYRVSGKDSVRILLMTATPITDNPFNLMKLLNLTSEYDIPDEEKTFTQGYLNEKDVSFTASGEIKFKSEVTGRISYLNRMKDLRQFAQPVIHNVNVPISQPEDIVPYLEKMASLENDIATLKTFKIGDTKKSLVEKIEQSYESKIAGCEEKHAKQADKKKCVTELKKQMREEKLAAEELAKEMVKEAKGKIAVSKESYKETKQAMKAAKRNDMSIATVLAKRCYKKEKEDSPEIKKNSPISAVAVPTA